jgi:hypothetical protein
MNQLSFRFVKKIKDAHKNKIETTAKKVVLVSLETKQTQLQDLSSYLSENERY